MTKLNVTSCRWALSHLKNESDTDLFPRPFEIDALAQNPQETTDILRSIDVGSYQWEGGRSVVVPKEMVSFRTATQLDPIDSLVLAAIIRQFGFRIERRRIPAKEEVVFSYRFKPTRDGHLYDRTSNWNKFWQASSERAQHSNWVVVADIASYYNQIYHHSVEQELQSAKIPQEVISAITDISRECFLGAPRPDTF